MQVDLSVGISVLAILVMFYCLWLVFSLGKGIPGGVVGTTWRKLRGLVVMFAIGFLVTPFFGLLSAELMKLIVSVIFLFGAVYVVITVRLIHRIIEELAA